ncbi:hypothetical protein NIES2107_12120 [Nostoc carneum NIES-2107]|nr:hypothetical protein NIES2107_12120 [Nostoc carneum NIES-2107]
MNSYNIKDLTLGALVLISILGLIGFAVIDAANSRSTFLEVAKICIATFLGYLIPNEKPSKTLSNKLKKTLSDKPHKTLKK